MQNGAIVFYLSLHHVSAVVDATSEGRTQYGVSSVVFLLKAGTLELTSHKKTKSTRPYLFYFRDTCTHPL